MSLEKDLRERAVWLHRVVGFDPDAGHAEPSWAVEVTSEDAVSLGRAFLQDAIYYVSGNDLSVRGCSPGAEAVLVGGFRERVVAVESP